MSDEKRPFRFPPHDNCLPHNHHVHRNHSKNFYEPWYNDLADYNTNAPSYYDYLARFNALVVKMQQLINKLLDRDLLVADTGTIDMTKLGDWQLGDDILTLSAKVLISNDQKNAIKHGSDGAIYAYDYKDEIKALEDAIKRIDDAIAVIVADVDKIKKRELVTINTPTVNMAMSAPWNSYASPITLMSNVKLSPTVDGNKNAITQNANGLYARDYGVVVDTIATRKTVWSGESSGGTISDFSEPIKDCDYLEITYNNGSTWRTEIFNFKARSSQHVNITNQSDSNPNFANIESIISVDSQTAPTKVIFSHMRTIRISLGNDQEEGVFTDARGEWLGDTAEEGYRNKIRSIQGAWYNYKQ